MPRLLTTAILPAALSGVLLWTAFFPLDLGVTALFALAPFLTLVRAPNLTRWQRYGGAFVGGVVFAALALKWVRVAHPMMALFTWPAGTLYCALYWPLALYLLRRLEHLHLPFTATLPVVWVGLEYVRTHFPTGFSFLEPLGLFQLVGFNWYALGYALHGFLPATQAADLGGVYLVSAMVACVNGVAYEWLIRSALVRRLFGWPALAPSRMFVLEAHVTPEGRVSGSISPPPSRTFVDEAYRSAWAAIFPVLVVCYGTVQLVHPPFAKGPRVAAVQGNVPQNEKIIRGDQDAADGLSRLERDYFPLAARAARPTPSTPAPDLVIWPETVFPLDRDDPDPRGVADPSEADMVRRGLNASHAEFVQKFAGLPPAYNLVGLNRHEWRSVRANRKFNSAVLFDPDRRAVASYDKMHLVPFGEYVPFDSPLLKPFTPYTHDYSCTPGSRLTRFEVPAAAQGGKVFTFAVLICYEDTDPFLARQYNPARGRGLAADFLVNISNDGWFAGTEEHAQHLAICRFRAIEARRSVVRAVNTGISAVIDPDGRVIVLPASDSWQDSAGVEAIVRAEVPIDTRETYYAMLGDWVPLACGLLFVGGRLWPRGRRMFEAWRAKRFPLA